MSGKPSYAAVADPNIPTGSGSVQNKQPIEAPPPYTSGPSNSPSVPHQTILPPPRPHPACQSHHVESGYTTPQPPNVNQNGWTPPTSEQVAKARAMRRFWMAFLWAWLIWILVGLVIGGGVSDIEGEPNGRHGHWDKHGRWRDDGWFRIVGGKTGQLEQDDWAAKALGEAGQGVVEPAILLAH